MQKEINKASLYLPKVKKLEKDLELIDGNEDAEIDSLPEHLNLEIKNTKQAIKKKQDEKKVADDDEKKKEYEAEYAYTPQEGFNWDNVSGAITDVI